MISTRTGTKKDFQQEKIKEATVKRNLCPRDAASKWPTLVDKQQTQPDSREH